MDINIGKILIQPKDTWISTQAYEYLGDTGLKGDTGATGKEGMSVTGATINANDELILIIDYRA